MMNSLGPVHFSDIVGPFFSKVENSFFRVGRGEAMGLLQAHHDDHIRILLSLDSDTSPEGRSACQEIQRNHNTWNKLVSIENKTGAYRFLHSFSGPTAIKSGLRRYFVEYLDSETLLASDTHHEALFFFQVMDKVIDKIFLMYDRLDAIDPRKDGRPHFDHAWGVVRNLLEVIGYHSKESLFAAFLHDYIEDVRKLDPKRYTTEFLKKEIRTLLKSLKKIINIDLVIEMVVDLTKKELSEHLDFGERMRLFFLTAEKSDIIQGSRAQELKAKRNAQYFGSLNELSNPVFFIKLADRFESLEHFEHNEIDFVERKLLETEQYFFPVIEYRMALEQDKNMREIYSHILRAMVQIFSDVRDRVHRLKDEGKTRYESGGEISLVSNSTREKLFYYIERVGRRVWEVTQYDRVEAGTATLDLP